MAKKVTVTQFGGSHEILENVGTISEIMKELDIEDGTSVTVNGQAFNLNAALSDYAFVSFGKKVTGGKL